MLNVIKSTPRNLRSFMRRMLGQSELYKLCLLSPAQCGSIGWHYAINYNGNYHIVSRPLPNRDFGRAQSVARFGVKAVEVRLERSRRSKQVA